MRPYLHPHQQRTITVTLVAMLISGFTPVISEPAHPAWWNDPARAVKNANPIQNKAVANIGQLKNIATQAHAELEALLPGGAGYVLPFDPPPVPADAAWYQSQKKTLNLGQLKAVSKPFYDLVNEIDPAWLKTQMEVNGLTVPGSPPHYPWDPTTPVLENYKVANVGQLKLVFALRLRQSTDGDALPDLLETALYGDSSGDGTADFDGDGLSDADEVSWGTSIWDIDTDHDGILDGSEGSAINALTPSTTTSTTTSLEVFTPLH